MCAIAGVIRLITDASIHEKMLKTMRRRGPDGQGVYKKEECTLLHTRLAIIDPVGGAQPMHLDWAGEHYVLSYNGELYNTDQIRRELIKLGHQFQDHSDTAVLLHAYAQWKEDALQKLNGIFAFAVWHENEKKLFLARDRIGVKPLFYMEHQGGLIFASEMKTILAYPTVRAQLDAKGASEIMMFGPGRVPGSGVFRGIYEIEPGCMATYENGKLLVKRYWKLTDGDHEDDFDTTSETVRWLVMDAINRQMVSDVPIGTFLSGGLDSSIISACCADDMARRGHRLKTFSVDYVDNDIYFKPGKFQPNADAEYIRIMERSIGSEHHWTVLSYRELEEQLQDATIARDLPGMADVDFSLLAFCRQIRKEVKVGLSGECADEIFGGYPWYRDPAVRNADGFPWAQNTKLRVELIQPWISQEVSGEDYIRSQYQRTIQEADIMPGCDATERRMKQMVNLNFRWFMQTLLDRKDRMSMYHGLEVRVPFCDYRIAEYLYRVPWKYKDYHGMEKGLLRHAVRGLLPDEVLHRKKSPYPKTYHPQYEKSMRDKLLELLKSDGAPLFQIVDRKEAAAFIDSTPAWPWYGQLMTKPQTYAYLLQINFWLKYYDVEVLTS